MGRAGVRRERDPLAGSRAFAVAWPRARRTASSRRSPPPRGPCPDGTVDPRSNHASGQHAASEEVPMCRNIRTLYDFDPPKSRDVEAAIP